MPAVFLDISRAFDTVPHASILAKLRECGINGRLYAWIRDYLHERIYAITIQDATFSATAMCGVPQGGVLSPRLFSLVVNGLAGIVPKTVTAALYADDVSLRASDTSLHAALTSIQRTLDVFTDYSMEWGLSFNSEKSAVLVLTTVPITEDEDSLTLNGCPIRLVQNHRVLGLHLDSRLHWWAHALHLQKSCAPRLAALASLANKYRGASRESLSSLYTALIRSRLDYASQVFVMCPSSATKKIDQIQNKALRIILGLPRSTAIAAMEIEANLPPLPLRRNTLFLKTLAKAVKFDIQPIRRLLTSRPTSIRRRCCNIRTTMLRLQQGSPAASLLTSLESTRLLPADPPWTSFADKLSLHDSWSSGPKDSLLTASLLHEFWTALDDYKRGWVYFTDGSRDPATGISSFAVVCIDSGQASGHRLPPGFSTLSSELLAMRHALHMAMENAVAELTIVTDSRSGIEVIRAQRHEYAHEIIALSKWFASVSIIWCPAHVGIAGNERADRLAKTALSSEAIFLAPPPLMDYHRQLRNDETLLWTKQWTDGDTGRLLHTIKPTPKVWEQSFHLTRTESRILAGLRCRRVSLNSILHQFERSASPRCANCPVEETVSHYLLTCPAYAAQRISLQRTVETLKLAFTLQNVLGGGPAPVPAQRTIQTALLQFISDTKTMKQLSYFSFV